MADSSALAMWAVWTVDSLYYLDEIVEADRTGPNFFAPHNPATKAVAHLRWAAGSAITAIDLCGAATARELRIKTEYNEFSARDLNKHKSCLSCLSHMILEWLDDLNADPVYKRILKARNPLTHSRLIRHFTTASSSIEVVIAKDRYSTDELISTARTFATKHVEAFVNVLETL